jgi:hypothetical protein
MLKHKNKLPLLMERAGVRRIKSVVGYSVGHSFCILITPFINI